MQEEFFGGKPGMLSLCSSPGGLVRLIAVNGGGGGKVYASGSCPAARRRLGPPRGPSTGSRGIRPGQRRCRAGLAHGRHLYVERYDIENDVLAAGPLDLGGYAAVTELRLVNNAAQGVPRLYAFDGGLLRYFTYSYPATSTEVDVDNSAINYVPYSRSARLPGLCRLRLRAGQTVLYKYDELGGLLRGSIRLTIPATPATSSPWWSRRRRRFMQLWTRRSAPSSLSRRSTAATWSRSQPPSPASRAGRGRHRGRGGCRRRAGAGAPGADQHAAALQQP